jgi:hypothetical protein
MAGEFKHTKAFLHKYGNSVEQEIKVRLRNNGKMGTGALYDSIDYEVTETSTKFKITFHMLDYGRFVDKGVEGSESGKAGEGGSSQYAYTNKMPPKEEIERWMKIKGIPLEASYPIRRKIFTLGITPTNFFTIPTTRRIKQLEQGVKEAMVKDIDENLRRQYGKNK